MEKYYDAFLYFANWGTRRLMVKLPSEAVGKDALKSYCSCDGLSFKKTGKSVLLDFYFENEGDYWEEPPSLSSLAPLREDILGGDMRALYLGWLTCVQQGGVEDDIPEPPVPAGLASLTPPLQSLAEFISLDAALIEIAAKGSEKPVVDSNLQHREISIWLTSLSESDRTRFLLGFLCDKAPIVRAEMMRQFLKTKAAASSTSVIKSRRTAGELLSLYRGCKKRKK